MGGIPGARALCAPEPKSILNGSQWELEYQGHGITGTFPPKPKSNLNGSQWEESQGHGHHR